MPRILQPEKLITQLMLSVSIAVGVSVTTGFPKQKSHAWLLFFPDYYIPKKKILSMLNVLSCIQFSANASMPLIAQFL